MIRTTWGAIRPTNPIRPLNETAAAVASVAATTNRILTFSTSTPSIEAWSSLSCKTLSTLANPRTTARLGTRYTRTTPLSLHSADMKLPRSQLNTGLSSGSLLIIKRLDTAPASAEIATPAKIRVVNGVPCELLATEYAIATAEIPPANAATGRRLNPPRKSGTPVRSTTVAPRPAPDATPTRYGSASGFLNRPWYAAPAIASAAPTIAARTTLGSRSSHRIVFHVGFASKGSSNQGRRERTIPTTDPNGISTEPWLAAKTAVAAKTSPPIASRHHGYRSPTSRAETA